MTHLYSLVELRVIFDTIQEKFVTKMTSTNTGSPITKVIIFCKPRIRTWDLTSRTVSDTGFVLENSEVPWYKPQNQPLSDALVPSCSYFWELFKTTGSCLHHPYVCVGWGPRIYHFPKFTEWARGENRNRTSSSGKLTLTLQRNQKEISSCIMSLLKIGPFFRLSRVGILMVEKVVCSEAQGSACALG